MTTLSLNRMKAGDSGFITAVKATGERQKRLYDLGFTPGTCLTVNGQAPFGGSLAVRLYESTVMLRDTDAEAVQVKRMRMG